VPNRQHELHVPPVRKGGLMRHITLAAIALIVLAMLVLAGCGGGGSY
jgi:hypothetical protein